jgi:hypothetical protein
LRNSVNIKAYAGRYYRRPGKDKKRMQAHVEQEVPAVGQVVSAGISYAAMRMIINAHIGQCYKVVKAVIETDRA